MTRRAWLAHCGRMGLLKWRLVRGRALPAVAMAWLRILDKWSAER